MVQLYLWAIQNKKLSKLIWHFDTICPWYYNFEELFETNLSVAPLFFSESGQPDWEQQNLSDKDDVNAIIDGHISWSDSQTQNRVRDKLNNNAITTEKSDSNDQFLKFLGSADAVSHSRSTATLAPTRVDLQMHRSNFHLLEKFIQQ